MRRLPDAPRYGDGDVSVVVPDAVTAVTGGRPTALALPEDVRGVVVLVVDGLGQQQLTAHADVAPLLSSRPGVVLDAPFPTTTATSLTSIGTGLTPGRHGIVGLSVAVPDDDRPLVLLTWTWERQHSGLDARHDVVPERYQPCPTAFERAAEAGVRAVTVLRPEFITSGLTRAGLRGAEVVTATGLDATLAVAVDVARQAAPAVVYAHHGDLDTAGHLSGPASDEWLAELARIDAVLDRATTDLRDDVVIVVTADHGMVAAAPDGHLELADRPDLLSGVRVLAGEGRVRQLHAVAGAADDVLDAWRDTYGAVAHVVTRDDAVAAGWFGPTVAPQVHPRIGDVVAVASDPGIAWVHRDADLFGGRLLGLHGALTAPEREVPALTLTRRGDL